MHLQNCPGFAPIRLTTYVLLMNDVKTGGWGVHELDAVGGHGLHLTKAKNGSIKLKRY